METRLQRVASSIHRTHCIKQEYAAARGNQTYFRLFPIDNAGSRDFSYYLWTFARSTGDKLGSTRLSKRDKRLQKLVRAALIVYGAIFDFRVFLIRVEGGEKRVQHGRGQLSASGGK